MEGNIEDTNTLRTYNKLFYNKFPYITNEFNKTKSGP